MRLQMYRYFDGKLFELRTQPAGMLHHDHVDCCTIRYKHVAERIAKYWRDHGREARVLKAANGWRVYRTAKE
jgi:hypothetical protein